MLKSLPAPIATARTGGRSGWLRTTIRLPWGYLLPALVVLGALSVYPLVQLVRLAFSDVGPANIVGSWPFSGTANLRRVLDDRVFRQAVGATLRFTLILLAIDLIGGFVGAALLSSRTWSTNLVLRLMVFVWALPPIVSGSVWKFLLAGNGAVNTALGTVGIGPVNWLSSPQLALTSVSLVAAWASLPFAILVVHGGMLSIPPEIIEAARIDGAGFWRLSRHVLLPALRPTLAVLTVLIVLYGFRSFDFVYVMTLGGPGTSTTTLPYLAYDTAFKTYQFGIAAATALVAMSAVLLLAVPYIIGIRRERVA